MTISEDDPEEGLILRPMNKNILTGSEDVPLKEAKDNLSLEKPFRAVPRSWSFQVQCDPETVANAFANSRRTSNIYLSKSNSAQR